MITTYLAAIATSLAIMALIELLKKLISIPLFGATALVAMAFIYVGFALSAGTAADIALECVVAVLFYFFAIFGYLKDHRLIAVGILCHGIWDSVHHYTSAANDSPWFWPDFCSTIDFIWSVYFYLHAIKVRKLQSAK